MLAHTQPLAYGISMNRVFIEVYGGCVQAIRADDPKTKIIMIDKDQAEIDTDAAAACVDNAKLAESATEVYTIWPNES